MEDTYKLLRVILIAAILIVIGAFCMRSCAQTVHESGTFKAREHVAPAVLVFASGAFDGLNQALQFRYDGFKRVFPKANDQWYNPAISWRNKYKNGDPSQGAKHFGSTSFLVGGTDAYHATRTVSNALNATAIVVKLNDGKKKWWVYVTEIAGYWFINRVGFSLVYNSF